MCKVSVVLPVYNVGAHIEETITSLLKQTFQDFEVLIIDDCSTDDTLNRVNSINNPKVRILKNEHNLGRAGTDNLALAHVRGEFIAKMDGDDICLPTRLAYQVAYLEEHPEINVVGSWMQNFGSSNYLNRYPAHPDDSQVLTLFTLPIGNPSVMLRTSLFVEQGMRYNAGLRQTEDYDFFARYINQLRIATIQQPLIQYRVPPDVQKKEVLSERATVADEVREQLLQQWQVPFTRRELLVYNTIAMLDRSLNDVSLTEVDAWLQKLIQHNDKQPLFDPLALRRGLGERWYEVCYTHLRGNILAIKQYQHSQLATYWPITGRQRLKLWLNTFRRF